jgi:cysteine desulfurase
MRVNPPLAVLASGAVVQAKRIGNRMGMRGAENGIYMDYQATTPADPRVVEAMQGYWSETYGNPHSADHAFGWSADAAVETARGHIATLIGADPDEIVFTSGATEANNLAVLGTARASQPSRKRIVVSAIEHKCVLAAARAAADEGFEVIVVPVGTAGIVDPNSIADILDDRVALVSVMAVNNEIGTVQPLSEIAALCARAGTVFHTDAAQALNALPVDVAGLGVDLMSLSAHKAYGPKGIGALFVRRGLRVRPKPIIHGGGQEGGLRSGTLPTPLCVGFGEACRILAAERDTDSSRIRALRDRFLTELLKSLPELRVNGDQLARHPGNLNLLFPSIDASLLLQNLHPKVAAAKGSACTSGQPESSHVLRAIGLSPKDADSSIRFSIGRFTTEDEIDKASLHISEVSKTLAALPAL